MIISRTRSWRRALGAAAACVLIAGACTSDDDGAETADTGEATADTGDTADTATAEDTGAATTVAGGDTIPSTAVTSDDTVVDVAQAGSRLEAVQEAGVVRCGTRDELPGFAFLDASGEHVGFDSDFCL